jgi:uncharacterized protein involved in exopolysaccharide biosynthesis
MNRELNQDAVNGGNGLGDLAAIFFRHKKKALFFSSSLVALATLIILFAPRKYRSEARLFLQVGRESVRLDPTATTGKTIALQQAGRDSEVATAIEVLYGRSILEQTVDRLTPEVVLGQAGTGQAKPNPVADAVLTPLRMAVAAIKNIDPISKREEAVIQLERNFEVDAEHESTVISLTYDAETAQLAQQIMDTIVDVYRQEHVRLHQTSGSKPFFEQQRDDLEQQLASAEQALRETKNRMGFASIESRRSTLERRLAAIELSRNGVMQSISAAEARITALAEHAQALPERLHTSTKQAPNTGADSLRSQLYGLQMQLMNLEAKFNKDHPLVAATQKQVDEAQQMLDGEADSREEIFESINTNQRALLLEQAQVESAQAGHIAQLAELDQQRAAVLAEMRKLNDDELEIQVLERNATIARTNFFGYAEKLEEARVDEELDRLNITNVVVAQQATLAEKPVSPSKMLVGALSLLLAIAGTAALVLACEKFDSRVHSEDQIESVLRLPVLAAVPEGRIYATAGGAGR